MTCGGRQQRDDTSEHEFKSLIACASVPCLSVLLVSINWVASSIVSMPGLLMSNSFMVFLSDAAALATAC